MILGGAIVAPMAAMPPPSGLASVMMSGSKPPAALANHSPARPKPVWISSATIRISKRLQIAPTSRRKFGGGTITPASP